MSSIALRRIAIAVGLISLTHVESGIADTSAVDADPQVMEARRRQAVAEAEKATAEAQRDAFKAKLGEIAADRLPKGATEIKDKLEVEGKILAYRAADQAIDMIVKDILKQKPPKVVFFSSKDFSNIALYRAFAAQSDLLVKQADAALVSPTLVSDTMQKPCVPVPVVKKGVAPLAAIDAGLQLLSLFKVDRSFSGNEVTLDDFAVHSIAGGKLRANSVQVAYPSSYFPSALALNPGRPKIFSNFDELTKRQVELDQFLARGSTRQTELSSLLEQSKDAACKAIYKGDITTLEAAQAKAKSVQAIVGQVNAGLAKVDDQSGLNLIQVLTKAELLATNFDAAYVLELKPIAAGGTSQIATSIFGSRLSFSGGVVIAYMLYDAKGELAASGAVPVYGGFVRSTDLR